MFAALTGIGLSAAAGLNAYIPFLAVALLDRFTDVVNLPVGWEWMSSWWAIGIVAVLLAAEVVLDKVPVVDTVNDTVQTFVRPATGGVIFAATTAASGLEASSWVQQHPWVSVLAGVVVAGLVHAGKATSRPVLDAASVGVATPVVSTVEDGASVGLSLVAIFLPVLVLVLLVALVWGFVWLRRRRPHGPSTWSARARSAPGPGSRPGPRPDEGAG